MSEQSFIRNGASYFRFTNGVEVKVRPVSPALIIDLQKKFPEPPVPIVESEVGDGTKIREENPVDPDYKRAWAEWHDKLDEKFRRLILLMAVECEVNPVEVKRVRDFFKSEFEVELDPNDKLVYLNDVLPSGNDEYTAFIDAVAGRSRPTEGAIAKAIEDFSTHVQG